MITRSDLYKHKDKLHQDDVLIVDERQSNRVIVDNLLDNIHDVFKEILSKVTQDSKLSEPVSAKVEVFYPNNKATYAGIEDNGGYKIKVSNPFCYLMFSYTDLISIDFLKLLERKFQIQASREQIRNMLFCAYCLIILCHETGHILNGHLDYLKDNGMISNIHSLGIEYIEVVSSDNNDNSLRKNLLLNEENQEIWLALEAEADSYASQTALCNLFCVDEIREIIYKINNIQNDSSIAYQFYGYVLATFFIFFDLIKSSEDKRHPKPLVRMYISATAFNQLVKIKGASYLDFIGIFFTLTKAYDEVIVELKFGGSSLSDKLEAVKLMFKINKILKKIDIDKYRKITFDSNCSVARAENPTESNKS